MSKYLFHLHEICFHKLFNKCILISDLISYIKFIWFINPIKEDLSLVFST